MEQAQHSSYLLQHIGPMLSRQLDQTMQEQVGIGQAQYKVLQLLRDTPNMLQHQMASTLGQTEASISRQIKLLTDRGLLSSRINPKSRRERLHALTPKGLKMTAAVDAIVAQALSPLWDQLEDKQQKQLAEALQIVHQWVCQPGRQTACNHLENETAS